MSAGKQLQLRLWLRALTIFEVRLRGKVSRERNAFIKASAASYVENGVVAGWLVTAHEKRLAGILIEHYSSVIPHFGAMVHKQIKSRASLERKAQTIMTAHMVEWVQTEGLKKAKTIAATNYDDVLSSIVDGIEAGEGTATVARAIRSTTGQTTWRAATIARTETHNAASFGSIETAREAEKDIGIVLLKEWLPTQDDRTRPEHMAMANSDAIPLNERFDVGGEMMDRPSDQSASAANVINCRCAIIYEEG